MPSRSREAALGQQALDLLGLDPLDLDLGAVVEAAVACSASTTDR